MTWLAFLLGIAAGISSCIVALIVAAIIRGIDSRMARPLILAFPGRRQGKTAAAAKAILCLRQREGRRVWS